jgi:hypothetical protein
LFAIVSDGGAAIVERIARLRPDRRIMQSEWNAIS